MTMLRMIRWMVILWMAIGMRMPGLIGMIVMNEMMIGLMVMSVMTEMIALIVLRMSLEAAPARQS